MKITGIGHRNNPGLCRVMFTEVSKVKRISHPDSNYEVAIELNHGCSFDEIYFTPTTEDVTIEQKEDDSGTWFEVTARLINPSLSSAKAVFFKEVEHKDLIVVIEDNNDKRILLGSQDKPARLSFKMSIPGSGRNQRQITIDAVHDREPYFVKSATTESGGSFSGGFSSGFPIP